LKGKKKKKKERGKKKAKARDSGSFLCLKREEGARQMKDDSAGSWTIVIV